MRIHLFLFLVYGCVQHGSIVILKNIDIQCCGGNGGGGDGGLGGCYGMVATVTRWLLCYWW